MPHQEKLGRRRMYHPHPVIIILFPFSKGHLTMEDFSAVLKNMHTKLCNEKIPQRDPSHVPLPIKKFMVSLKEIDHMLSLIHI